MEDVSFGEAIARAVAQAVQYRTCSGIVEGGRAELEPDPAWCSLPRDRTELRRQARALT
jgi:hypothetical protein